MEFIGFILTIIIFLAFASIYILYVTRGRAIPKSKNRNIDYGLVREKWSGINLMMKEGGPINYRQAIIEADKLVDMILRAKVEGETMGERLKAAKDLFTHHVYDQLWTAHKIRNKVAHETEFEGLSSDAKLAIRNFEKALQELGAI